MCRICIEYVQMCIDMHWHDIGYYRIDIAYTYTILYRLFSERNHRISAEAAPRRSRMLKWKRNRKKSSLQWHNSMKRRGWSWLHGWSRGSHGIPVSSHVLPVSSHVLPAGAEALVPATACYRHGGTCFQQQLAVGCQVLKAMASVVLSCQTDTMSGRMLIIMTSIVPPLWLALKLQWGTFADFTLPTDEENFTEIRYEWATELASKVYMRQVPDPARSCPS